MKSRRLALAYLLVMPGATRAAAGIIVTDQWRVVNATANASRCGSDEQTRDSSDPGEFSQTALAQMACETGTTTATIVQRSYVGTDGLRAESVSSSVATPTQQVHFRYYDAVSLYSVNFELDAPAAYRIVMRAYSLLSQPDSPNIYLDEPFAFVELRRDDQPYLEVISYWNGNPAGDLRELATQVVLEPGRYALNASSRLAGDFYFAAPGLTQSSAGFSVELAPARCSGDTDRDSDVDIQDLAAVLARTGGYAFGDGPDLTGDGRVDLEDLTIVLANFGTSCEE